MNNDAMQGHTNAAWPLAAAATFEADDPVFGGVWWLTGSAFLAAWTGLALLLTA